MVFREKFLAYKKVKNFAILQTKKQIGLSLKKLQKTASKRLRTKQIYVEDFILKKVSTCSSYQLQLEAYYSLQLEAKDKVLYLLKPQLAQKGHAQFYSVFLFCSIIITQLLSTGLKNELQFLPVSEMGKFHTLALNFKD